VTCVLATPRCAEVNVCTSHSGLTACVHEGARTLGKQGMASEQVFEAEYDDSSV
jgi:hypothetical protein